MVESLVGHGESRTPLRYVSEPIGRRVRVQPAIGRDPVDDDCGVSEQAGEAIVVLDVERIDVRIMGLECERSEDRNEYPSNVDRFANSWKYFTATFARRVGKRRAQRRADGVDGVPIIDRLRRHTAPGPGRYLSLE